MTDNTDPAALTAEVERLRKHSESLLNEKRQIKAERDDVAAKLSAAEVQRDKLAGDLQAIRLDGPVERLIEQTATDPVIFRALFDRAGYRFELDDDDRPRIVDAEGEPLATTGPDGKAMPVPFEPAALASFLLPPSLPATEWTDDQRRFAGVLAGSRASGSGATAHSNGGTVKQTPEKPQPSQSFGLK